MKTTVKKLSELRRAEKNIRRHNDTQIKEYIRSLEMFGQIRPIVCDENGVILAGNGLYESLLAMGRTEADCYVVTGLSENEKKKLMLADNRVFELGITDASVFEEIVLELDGDTDIPGWDEDLLVMLNAADSEVDEMISGYGAYEAEDVARLAAKAPAVAPAPGQVSETGFALPYMPPPDSGETVTDEESPLPVSQEMPVAQAQRFIICPKCGERICL